MLPVIPCLLLAAWPWAAAAAGAKADSMAAAARALFAERNLVAWCVVPFDSRRRGPEERAEMLRRLGFTRLAYDWRAEHIPTFDEELETLARWGIALEAFWFPGGLNDEAMAILAALERHKIRTQLWVTLGLGDIATAPDEHRRRVRQAADIIRPVARAAATIGCTVGLYNHGGWFGEPDHQIEIIRELARSRPPLTNVGIVYNQHHGHGHVDRFAALLDRMIPHLYCLNLNGMVTGGEGAGKKIWPLGHGEMDLQLLRAICASGYRGPIGILGHTMDDAEDTLRDNLDGLAWLLPQLDAGANPPPAPLPPLRRASLRDPASPRPNAWEVENPHRRAELPECQMIPAARTEELTPAAPALPLPGRDWPRSHGDAASTRFSSLNQINRNNVGRLRAAWTYHSKDGQGNIQCNPVVIDGILYAPTVGEHLVAINAATGREIWRFKPGGRPAHRGLTYWKGDETHPARLLVSAGEFLWAVDPASGKPVSTFGDGGKVRTGQVVVAGAVFRHVVVLPGFGRDVQGFDVRTGKHLWTFHTIPQAGEFAADTWNRPENGANCWGGMALDETRGIAFVSTGSPKPDFIGVNHQGSNLFANCVIALDALTGKRLWHFQEVRHDIWDLDIPAPPNLASITCDGRRVDVVTQVTKLGNTLVLDRTTGKPLFPFRLRRAPVSKLPGERTWPYQPALELPEPFSKQVFTADDVTTRTPVAHEAIRSRIAGANMGWFEPFEEGKPTVISHLHGGGEWTGAAVDPRSGRLYVSANELQWIISVFRPDERPRDPNLPPTAGQKLYEQHCASCHGADRIGIGMAPPLQSLGRRMNDVQVIELLKSGRNSMPVAPPMTREETRALLDFLFQRDLPAAAQPAPPPSAPHYSHNGYPKLLDPDGYPACKPPWGTLNCIDLNTGRIVWKVPLGEYPQLVEEGLTGTGAENFGGPTVTAGGLVFCAGTPDAKIRAFDADTGEELWQHMLPWGGYAPPAVYEADGRQYVVLAATGGGKLGGPMGDAYIAFALGE